MKYPTGNKVLHAIPSDLARGFEIGMVFSRRRENCFHAKGTDAERDTTPQPWVPGFPERGVDVTRFNAMDFGNPVVAISGTQPPANGLQASA
jgi:hypothetical protein